MARELLIHALQNALAQAQTAGELSPDLSASVELQAPRDRRWGDFTTSLAMALANEVGRPPREAAEIILRHLSLPEELVERVEVAGGGFINFRLSREWLRGIVQDILAHGDDFARWDEGQGRRLNIEFVSANPTGPMAVVNGRAAAIGDTLANLFARAGWAVSREYYVNDALNSTQIRRFAETLEARYLRLFGQEAAIPEDGYQGDYVVEMAEELKEAEGDRYLNMPAAERLTRLTEYSLTRIVESHQRDMQAFGVHFDTWFMESSLYEGEPRGQAGEGAASSEVGKALEVLKGKGHTYEAEGALWLRTTDFGDERDDVLVRRDGRPGYLAADIAYHKNKFDRGFDRLLDIWGPDHHGHVMRLRAGVRALGYEASQFEILIHQVVRLFRGSEMVRMSKRAGDIVPLSGLIEDVGTDAARFFFLMQSMDSHLDFDLELAKKRAADNPVYYVQYAHARICSILRSAEERSVPSGLPGLAPKDSAALRRLETAQELDLMRKLAELPEEMREAVARYEPHRLTRYAGELAKVFHGFYTDCRVLSDDRELTAARLALVMATRTVLRIVLSTIGVGAPESM